MEKFTIGYVDEEPKEIRQFQKSFADEFSIIEFKPVLDFQELLDSILSSGIDGIVIDYLLNDKPSSPLEIINYTGAELIEAIWAVRNDFPAIILTNNDSDALESVDDVNYVYSKSSIKDNSTGKISLKNRFRIQIDHYKRKLENISEEFNTLYTKSKSHSLTKEEEKRLLELDSLLESMIDKGSRIPIEEKNDIAYGKIDELIASTKQLIQKLEQESE